MVMRDRLIELLKGNLLNFSNDVAFWHDEHIGELADYLLANGVVKVVRCKDCTYLKDGFCTENIYGVGYKKTNPDGFCDSGVAEAKAV